MCSRGGGGEGEGEGIILSRTQKIPESFFHVENTFCSLELMDQNLECSAVHVFFL